MSNNKVVFEYEKIKKAINYLFIAYNKSKQLKRDSGCETLDYNYGLTNADYLVPHMNNFQNDYCNMCGDLKDSLEYMLDDMKEVLATTQNWDETSNDIKDNSKANYINRASSNNVAKKKEKSTSIWDDLEHL